MSQLVNKFLAQMPTLTLKGNDTGSTANPADLTVAQVQAMLSIPTSSSPLSIAAGGTGQSTQQAALNALAGAVTSGEYLRGNGTNVIMSGIQAGDVPTLNQNTTGTAANVTATSNSTLTTLSALTTAGSLVISGSQVSGGIFGAINGSALTNLSAANISGILPVGVTGGSGLSIATSQLTGQATLAQLPSIADNTILGNNSGSTGVPIALTPAQVNAILPVFTTSLNGLAPASGGGSTNFLRADGTWAAPAGTGTVTSVALSDGSTTPIYTISGSPVTGSGTLTQTLNTQSANTVFAGPSTGSAAQPTFRALVAGDIPSLSATYLLLAGGTMSGAIAMGSNKITGLASGTATGDALQWGQIGVASGIAGLDGGGKVPLSQLPSALMEFQGNWDPSTNTPALVDGTGTAGFTYWVSVAHAAAVSGLTDPSMVNFQVGDLVIYNGTKWVLTTPAAGVQSVNGAQGAVTFTMATANGFAGTYSGTALTVSTTITGLLKGNGTAISAASAGTDYVVPSVTTLSSLSLPQAQVSGTSTQVTYIDSTGFQGGDSAFTFNDTSKTLNATHITATDFTGHLVGNADTATTATNVAGGAAGSIPLQTGSGATSMLAIGTSGYVLTSNGTTATWSATSATATNNVETFVLSGTDITNQYITLAHTPLAGSVNFRVLGGGNQLEGVGYDYTISGATIVFHNGLATGGVSALVATDILQIQYEY